MTGDALYCQRGLCRQIRRGRGHYLLVVKPNQPELRWALATLFAAPPPGERFGTAVTHDQHGDRREVRRLWASTALEGYLDWPGAKQVACVERVTTTNRGRRSRQVRYVITSQGPEVGPAALLAQVRGHWAIENRLHWVRDATLGEDACRVRSGAAPRVLAGLRNAALALLRSAGHPNIAAAVRHYGWRPGEALALLGVPRP